MKQKLEKKKNEHTHTHTQQLLENTRKPRNTRRAREGDREKEENIMAVALTKKIKTTTKAQNTIQNITWGE